LLLWTRRKCYLAIDVMWILRMVTNAKGCSFKQASCMASSWIPMLFET
jgi:hypothetical protein